MIPEDIKASTLAAVAEAAGVSTATVARVMKGQGYVAHATRERIELVLKRTGYRPNALARGLRTQKSFVIGQLLSRIGGHPLFAEIARVVEHAAEREGYNLMLVNLESDPTRERKAVLRLIESRVAAMIFAHAVDPANIDLAIAAGIPVVQVERALDRPTALVLIDNQPGCDAAMSHLLALGHRRIGFIGADPAFYQDSVMPIEAQRLGAWRDALRRAGIIEDPDLLRLGRYPLPPAGITPGPYAPGFAETRALLALPNPPTALFVTGDVLASGALQAVNAAGLAVPHDISVIGYDNILAPYLSPPLSAVALPTRAMGDAAFRLALDCIEGAPPRTITLATELQLRASTAAPAE